jgi:PTH1 family peptidyl-tRNA hydrolase
MAVAPLIVVGLGNPGQKYAATRHNLGFMAADALISRHNLAGPQLKFKSQVFEGRLGETRILIAKPQTFMNVSGEAVQALVQFFKVPLSNLIVLHDELDLPVGKIRMKTGGSNAGHNGLVNIDSKIGNLYRRIRIGIGHPGDKNKVHDYVLGEMPSAERKEQEHVLEAIAKAFPLAVEGKDEEFVNKVALLLLPQPMKKK